MITILKYNTSLMFIERFGEKSMNAHVKSSKLKYYLIHYRKLFRSKLKDLYYYIINKIDRKKLIKLFETKQEQIFIKTLHLQVANICNANCIYCAYQFVKHKTGVMDFNIFKNAVDQFTELGGDIISLTPTIGEEQ